MQDEQKDAPKLGRTVTPNGAEIRRIRIKQKGWSIEDLAEKAGVQKGLVARAEESQPIFPKNLKLIADALGAEVGELLPSVIPSSQGPMARAEFYVLVPVPKGAERQFAVSFAEKIRRSLNISDPVRIVSVDPGGSLFITVEMPYSLASKLESPAILAVLERERVDRFTVYPPASSSDEVYYCMVGKMRDLSGKPTADRHQVFFGSLPVKLYELVTNSWNRRPDPPAQVARRSNNVRYVFRNLRS
jgi:lambda repressor-like predicted transcriptional regulator